MVIAQGGRFGGWVLYAKDRKAKFAYNVLGHPGVRHRGRDRKIPAGTHQVRMEFAYDGGGLAKGGDVTLYYDGQPPSAAAGSGRRSPRRSPPTRRPISVTSLGTTVSADYTAHGSRFSGKISWVQIDLGDDDHDHFIDPDHAMSIAMSLQ